MKTIKKYRFSNYLLLFVFGIMLLLGSKGIFFGADEHILHSSIALSNLSEKHISATYADLSCLSLDKNAYSDKSSFIEIEENSEEDEKHTRKDDFSSLTVFNILQPYFLIKANGSVSNCCILSGSIIVIPLHIRNCVFLI